jgi:predicted nucleic-acid-binding protein
VIALDTNVLVRFLVEDDPGESARARKLIEEGLGRESPFFVADVVLCEVVWVLRSNYRLPKADTLEILEKLLHATQLTFSSSDRIARSLRAFRSGRGDFADYLIREEGRDLGCETMATFDRDLLKETGFAAP